jgi:hypothetical protein
MRFLTISGPSVATDGEFCPNGNVRLEAREAIKRAVCVTMRRASVHASGASPSDGVRRGPPWRRPWLVAGAIASAAGARSPAGLPGSGTALRPIAAACQPCVSANS